jgi:hypothetical protein
LFERGHRSPARLTELTRAWTVSDEDPTHVRARFHDPAAASRALENRRHASQQQPILPDGTVELYFGVAGMLEIMAWNLTSGDTIEVLESPELCARLTEVSQAMAKRYAS